MDEWYALLYDEQEAEHDRVCNEGAECRRRDEHIQGTYIPIALKQKIERMQKEHAEEIRKAKAEGWEQGWEAAIEQAPGDTWFDEWHYQTNPYGGDQ